jgi:hypothetical protein
MARISPRSASATVPRERPAVPADVAEWPSAGYRCQADHLAACAAPFCQELSSSESRRAVAAGAEVIAHNSERSEKALGLLWRLEPPHGALTLTRRLV